MSRSELEQLIATWESRAKRKFIDAEREKDAMGRRLIEHGATCYFNCAQELKAAIALPEPPPSASPPSALAALGVDPNEEARFLAYLSKEMCGHLRDPT